MPKPRSNKPAIVTSIALVLLLAISALKIRYPDFIADKYLVVALIVLVVIPIVIAFRTLRNERLDIVLGKMDAENRHVVESIIEILKRIYLNHKKMTVSLARTMDESKTAQMFSGVMRALRLRLFDALQPYTGGRQPTLWEKIKLLRYAIQDIGVIAFILLSLRLVPYSIREMRFLTVAAVPDTLGMGLASIEDTEKDINKALKKRLWHATSALRTTTSINAIYKCLQYSHAINNLSLFQLKAPPKETMPYQLRLYAVLFRLDPDIVMSQKFAQVANIISADLGG